MKEKYENPKYYTLEEVESHNNEVDCWTVVDGKVYNLTHFQSMHPGGRKALKRAMGKESSDLFRKIFKS